MSFSKSNSQDVINNDKLKVFIDCSYCDVNFVKQEMNYLTFVRDRLLSDVHIQILGQSTGSGGEEFSLFFFGQNDFEHSTDTLVFSVDANQTEDEIRRNLLKNIQFGLVPFLIKKGFMKNLELSVSGFDDNQEIEVDPWRNWVYSVHGSSWFNGEESYKSISANGSFEANKITEDIKIESRIGFYFGVDKFELIDDTIKSISRSQFGNISMVKSLNPHWSVGGFFNGNASLYSNYKLKLQFSPGIEYNVFPYSESTKRQIRWTYKIGGSYTHYNDTTVYNKIEENLLFESLGVAAEFKEKWGSVTSSINGSHYFHDLNINSVTFRLYLNLRLAKGLSWRLGGTFRLIHDQIALAKSGVTEEEILLQQRQLQTGYQYWGNMGLTYTFGSIYNDVVNPRFGN